MPKNAIIVGMPRSGTSLAASIFVRRGYFAAEDEEKELRVADEFNPSGYWESEAFVRSNVEIFQQVDFPCDNTWLFEPISMGQANAINELPSQQNHQRMIDAYNRHSPWVLKDPRFCYTLGYWWQLVDQENTRVLLVRRKPKDILNSFVRLGWRENTSAGCRDVLQRVDDHLAAAERAIIKFDIPYLSINYADYEACPVETAQKLNDFFALDLSANDLGYSKRYNNSSIRGKIAIKAQKVADRLPPECLKWIKRMLPRFIFKRLFPAKKDN